MNPFAVVVIVAGSPATFVRVHTSMDVSFHEPFPRRFVHPAGVDPIWPDTVPMAITHRSPTFAVGNVIVTPEPTVFENVVYAEMVGPLFA